MNGLRLCTRCGQIHTAEAGCRCQRNDGFIVMVVALATAATAWGVGRIVGWW